MAKKAAPDIPFRIQVPADGAHVPAGDITVTGSGSPANTLVTGILTETTTGATIQPDPVSDEVGDLLVNGWRLTFLDVPVGDYVLAVQQLDLPNGADAVSITVDPAVAVITID